MPLRSYIGIKFFDIAYFFPAKYVHGHLIPEFWFADILQLFFMSGHHIQSTKDPKLKFPKQHEF